MNFLPWLDDLADFLPILEKLFRDRGFSLAVATGIAVFIIKKYRKKSAPRQMDRIEWKLDYIAEREGIEWPAEKMNSFKSGGTKWYRFSVPFRALVQNVKIGGKNMQKLKSRKFILAVVTALLVIANDGLDLGIDSDTVLTFAGIVATWIIGESAVDAKRAGKETKHDNSIDIPTDDRV